jgi:hypothetical protein
MIARGKIDAQKKNHVQYLFLSESSTFLAKLAIFSNSYTPESKKKYCWLYAAMRSRRL